MHKKLPAKERTPTYTHTAHTQHTCSSTNTRFTQNPQRAHSTAKAQSLLR
eukprot:m.351511 g.351511  ORF g.351511 m.351511 type:complete len:50 (-) comp16264_c0_seq1:690-839(-)